MDMLALMKNNLVILKLITYLKEQNVRFSPKKNKDEICGETEIY